MRKPSSCNLVMLAPQTHCALRYLIGEGLRHRIEFVQCETLCVDPTVAETLRRTRVFTA